MAGSRRPGTPRRPAAVRSTSGSGYAYEDLVAAWFLSKALVGEPIPGLAMPARSVHFQNRPSGWLIDDLVVTGEDGAQAAVSCKSGVRVGRDALPSEFVSDLRTQWADPGPFDPARDRLMHASQAVAPEFQSTWTDLTTWAAGDDPGFALDRIRAETRPLKILRSLRIAGDPAGTAFDPNLLRYIQRTSVLELNLERSQSAERDAALGRCRQALVDGATAEANELWRKLVDLARAARLGTGALLMTSVWTHLRSRFRLRDRPDFASAWTVLTAFSEDQRARCETTLPTGVAVPREALCDRLLLALESAAVVVFGDSGAGKSALVKSTLDSHRQDWRQVWLGPDALSDLLDEAERTVRGLLHPLREVLASTGAPTNVLVVDSAEKVGTDHLSRLKAVIEALDPGQGTWRVVIITQSDDYAVRQKAVLGALEPQPVEVGSLSSSEVAAALSAKAETRWLASEASVVEALGNPRTLGWVMEAGAAEPGAFVSHTAIADHLWRRWTQNQLPVEGVVIRLALREAEFERSFPFSRLSPEDQAALQTAPALLPLHRGSDNRYTFDHDLVADWARFQKLKEDAENLSAWVPFAAHPMWINALRLMAQHLLRIPRGGKTAWDEVLQKAEAQKESPASDMLLEALALDPQADLFLGDRADLLLANDGKRLNRLLGRFHHVATAPSSTLWPEMEPAMRLYMEGRFRSPIIGRWGPVARFLAAHSDKIAPLMSPMVSRVCNTWLTGTPPTGSKGDRFPYRRDLAELALAAARHVQIAQRSNVIFGDDSARSIFEVALQAAEDIPDAVGTWALEMARRRPEDAFVAGKVAEERRQRQMAHKARMRSDPVFREKELERRNNCGSGMIFGLEEDLPPWPFGPSGRIDHDFRRVCIRENGLVALMRNRPPVATELLLALLIEDEPKARRAATLASERWGLESDVDDGSLPAPYRSPFFAFLGIEPSAAVDALLKLIGFCMERWADSERRSGDDLPEPFSLDFEDGPRRFPGDFEVFAWGSASHLGAPQLHNALAALEKWLCIRLDQGEPIDDVLAKLLADQRSAAFLGVAINVGKHQPDLFKGVLRPLLGDPGLYVFDNHRVEQTPLAADSFNWLKYGQASYEASQQWVFADYRRQNLVEVAVGLARADAPLAAWLAGRVRAWASFDDPGDQLRLELLQSRLDPKNYSEGDAGALIFATPASLAERIAAHEGEAAAKLDKRLIAPRLADALKDGRPITDDSAAWAATLFDEAAKGADEDDEEGTQATVRLAVAGILIALAPDWLTTQPDREQVCKDFVRDAALGISPDWEVMHASGFQYEQGLELIAWAATRRWVVRPEEDWAPSILSVALSGSGRAASAVVIAAYQNRERLGARWRRLLQVLLWRVALGILSPSHGGDQPAAALWSRRMRWLRTRSLDVDVALDDLDPIRLRDAAGRLLTDRRRRLPERERSWRETNARPPAFNDHLLDIYFGWLTEVGSSDDEIALMERFWRYAAERQRTRGEAGREYRYPEHFEYRLIERLAVLSVSHPKGDRIWKAVFSIGPLGYQSAGRFLSHLFLHLEEIDADRFMAVWRAIMTFGLSEPAWKDGQLWYYRERLLRHVMGFELSGQLAKLPDAEQRIASLRDLYHSWASDHLTSQGDNVEAFTRFLTSPAAALLRIDGLLWLAEAARSEKGLGYWRRDDNTADLLIEFLDLVLNTEADRLRTDAVARDAMLRLILELTKRQYPMGLVLQERVRQLGK